MKVKVVESLPEAARVSGRDGPLVGVFRTAREVSPKYVEVTADSTELTKLYKSAIQYRSRHPEEGIRLRKLGNVLYVWVEVEGVLNNESVPRAKSKSPRSNTTVRMEPQTSRPVRPPSRPWERLAGPVPAVGDESSETTHQPKGG